MELLPALSSSWKDGMVSGLKVRGNVEVGMQWVDGALTSATIISKNAGNLTIT